MKAISEARQDECGTSSHHDGLSGVDVNRRIRLLRRPRPRSDHVGIAIRRMALNEIVRFCEDTRRWHTILCFMYVYAFDLGFNADRLPNYNSFAARAFMRRHQWTLCDPLFDFHDNAISWFSFSTVTICIDRNGLGFLMTRYALGDGRLKGHHQRLSVIGNHFGGAVSRRLSASIRVLNDSCASLNEEDMTLAMLLTIEGECESIKHNIGMGRFDYATGNDVALQRHRLERLRTSTFLKPLHSKDYQRARDLLLDADSLLDGFFQYSDKGALRASDILMFGVSLATVLALVPADWSKVNATGIRVAGLLIFIMAGLFIYSRHRKS